MCYLLLCARAIIKATFESFKASAIFAGGTFALYSLLCRHANIKTIPNQDRTDEELTTYSRSIFVEHSFAAKTKRWLEGRRYRKSILLILVIIGSCMVIGDGILTPAISGNFPNNLRPFDLIIYVHLFLDVVLYLH